MTDPQKRVLTAIAERRLLFIPRTLTYCYYEGRSRHIAAKATILSLERRGLIDGVRNITMRLTADGAEALANAGAL